MISTRRCSAPTRPCTRPSATAVTVARRPGRMPMPELRVAERCLHVAPARNLLDALLDGWVAVPYRWRAGSFHACLVRVVRGERLADKAEAIDQASREQGCRLACQCRIVDDLV